MPNNQTLHIYEEIFLLALRDKEGIPFATVNYRHAVAGAILAELLMKQIVAVESKSRVKYLKINRLSKTGDELIDECIAKISGAKRRAQLKSWVQRFVHLPRMKTRIAQQLCRKNILREEEGRVLFIFKNHIYPEVDPRPEKQIITKIEKAVFGNATEVEPEVVILISICKSVGLLNKLFDRKRLKARKERIKRLTDGELIGKATKEAIEAMQAAVLVAATVPVVAVSN